LFFLVKLV